MTYMWNRVKTNNLVVTMSINGRSYYNEPKYRAVFVMNILSSFSIIQNRCDGLKSQSMNIINVNILEILPQVNFNNGDILMYWLNLITSHCLCGFVRRDQPNTFHDQDDIIKLKHFPRHWPFVVGIHWSWVDSPTKASDAEFDVFFDLHRGRTVEKTIELHVDWDAIVLIMTLL